MPCLQRDRGHYHKVISSYFSLINSLNSNIWIIAKPNLTKWNCKNKQKDQQAENIMTFMLK
jgi:hypothetical protein